MIADDHAVNQLEVQLDDACSHLIVRRQPAANDLRTIMATITAMLLSFVLAPWFIRELKRKQIGQIVRHRVFSSRGVIFDIDPVFNNTEEWWLSIPEEIRPSKDQPFYHLLAENEESSYVAYVSQQNLLEDEDGGPVDHPGVDQLFEDFEGGKYRLRRSLRH